MLVVGADVLSLAIVTGEGVAMLSGADVSVTVGSVPVNAGSPVGVAVCDTVDV